MRPVSLLQLFELTGFTTMEIVGKGNSEEVSTLLRGALQVGAKPALREDLCLKLPV